MRVTHISEEMALDTTNALLGALPDAARRDSTQHPKLVSEWLLVMVREFGYRWREDLGRLVRSV